jgi:hypothetical protein
MRHSWLAVQAGGYQANHHQRNEYHDEFLHAVLVVRFNQFERIW